MTLFTLKLTITDRLCRMNTTSTKQPILRIKNLDKAFGENQVLKGLNLEVTQGKTLALIGGSGSGKSVLVKCLLGLIPVDGGEVLFEGASQTNLALHMLEERMKKVGVLFQYSGLFDSLPVWENVVFKRLFTSDKNLQELHEQAVVALNSMGLPREVADLYPAEISGGMNRRVGLARALFGDPELVIIDSPIDGLDPITCAIVGQLIEKQLKAKGCTVILITHQMPLVRNLADQVAMLYQGQILWHKTINTLDKPGNAIVDQFVYARAEGPYISA